MIVEEDCKIIVQEKNKVQYGSSQSLQYRIGNENQKSESDIAKNKRCEKPKYDDVEFNNFDKLNIEEKYNDHIQISEIDDIQKNGGVLLTSYRSNPRDSGAERLLGTEIITKNENRHQNKEKIGIKNEKKCESSDILESQSDHYNTTKQTFLNNSAICSPEVERTEEKINSNEKTVSDCHSLYMMEKKLYSLTGINHFEESICFPQKSENLDNSLLKSHLDGRTELNENNDKKLENDGFNEKSEIGCTILKSSYGNGIKIKKELGPNPESKERNSRYWIRRTVPSESGAISYVIYKEINSYEFLRKAKFSKNFSIDPKVANSLLTERSSSDVQYLEIVECTCNCKKEKDRLNKYRNQTGVSSDFQNNQECSIS